MIHKAWLALLGLVWPAISAVGIYVVVHYAFPDFFDEIDRQLQKIPPFSNADTVGALNVMLVAVLVALFFALILFFLDIRRRILSCSGIDLGYVCVVFALVVCSITCINLSANSKADKARIADLETGRSYSALLISKLQEQQSLESLKAHLFVLKCARDMFATSANSLVSAQSAIADVQAREQQAEAHGVYQTNYFETQLAFASESMQAAGLKMNEIISIIGSVARQNFSEAEVGPLIANMTGPGSQFSNRSDLQAERAHADWFNLALSSIDKISGLYQRDMQRAETDLGEAGDVWLPQQTLSCPPL